MSAQPHVPQAEDSVIAEAIRRPASIPEVTSSSGLKGEDFYSAANRLIWDWVVEAFYADDPVDALTVAANLTSKLRVAWACQDAEVIPRVQKLLGGAPAGRKAAEHGRLIRQASDKRKLLSLSAQTQASVQAGEDDPLLIAGLVAQEASKIATGLGTRTSTLSYDETGQVFIAAVREAQQAQLRGQQIGVWTGVGGIDKFTSGLQPGEVIVSAGEPGVGKSGVWGRCALNFAQAQAKKPKDQRVGTLIVSMEMGPVPFGSRIAQMVALAKTEDMRSGQVTDKELNRLQARWDEHSGLPLWVDYTPNPKVSQLRAIIAEAVRRYNVGFVIIDHFKTFRLDQRTQNANDEDEEKIIFLKYQIAQEMNVAVVCLAHTRKTQDPNGRPYLSDLRGSGQISAHADFVNFLYRPWKYASEADREAGRVSKTEAEFIWAKNRFGDEGRTELFLDLEWMMVK